MLVGVSTPFSFGGSSFMALCLYEIFHFSNPKTGSNRVSRAPVGSKTCRPPWRGRTSTPEPRKGPEKSQNVFFFQNVQKLSGSENSLKSGLPSSRRVQNVQADVARPNIDTGAEKSSKPFFPGKCRKLAFLRLSSNNS